MVIQTPIGSFQVGRGTASSGATVAVRDMQKDFVKLASEINKVQQKFKKNAKRKKIS